VEEQEVTCETVAVGAGLSPILTCVSTADPEAIPVSGPLDVLQALPYISTEPVDVTGLRADATRSVRLRLPAGIQSTRDAVTVRLRVAPAQGEITMVVSLQLTNVPESLRPFVQTPNLTLRLSGEIPTLISLTTSNVAGSICRPERRRQVLTLTIFSG
jgi:YbbR domain-containing protein